MTETLTLSREQALVHAHKVVDERFVHGGGIVHDLLYQIRMRRADDRDGTEAELKDALVLAEGVRNVLEDVVRVLLRELEPIAEEGPHRLDARDVIREPKLNPAVHVQR